MKRTVNFYEFCDAFRDMDRNDQFSYEGKQVLFDFLEMLEDDIGEDIELDVIALCCDFYEDDWQDIADNYSIDLSDLEDNDEKEQAVIDYLMDNTCFVGQTSGTLLYANF